MLKNFTPEEIPENAAETLFWYGDMRAKFIQKILHESIKSGTSNGPTDRLARELHGWCELTVRWMGAVITDVK